jgi:host factor-I protein
MQSFGEQRGHGLDTSLPSVRHIQEWIRSRRPVQVLMVSGLELQGRIRWQDPLYIAVQAGDQDSLTLLHRNAIAVLRQLE